MKITGRCIVLCLCCLWLLLPLTCHAADVVIPEQNYQELRTLLSEQSQLLNQLETLSLKDEQSLKTLSNELMNAKESLEKAKSDLLTAEKSLHDSRISLAEQNALLAQMSREVKQAQAVSNRRHRQTVLWSIIAGIAVVAGITVAAT